MLCSEEDYEVFGMFKSSGSNWLGITKQNWKLICAVGVLVPILKEKGFGWIVIKTNGFFLIETGVKYIFGFRFCCHKPACPPLWLISAPSFPRCTNPSMHRHTSLPRLMSALSWVRAMNYDCWTPLAFLFYFQIGYSVCVIK